MMLTLLLLSLPLFACGDRTADVPANSVDASVAIGSPIATSTPPVPGRDEKKIGRRVQVRFSMEEEIEHPVPLPEDVLQILKRDDYVRVKSLKEGEGDERITSSLFVASEIDLNDDGLQDLVVTGSEESFLSGANNTAFWIFQTTPNGHRLVLDIGTQGFRILESKTNGFRNIEAGSQIPARIMSERYVFDGERERYRPEKLRSWKQRTK